MLLVSVIGGFSNSAHSDPLVQAVTLLQRSVLMVQCGLILFLLLFSQFLGVSRKQKSFGVALGFGLFASVQLLLLALYAGRYLDIGLMALVNTIMYDLAIVVWIAYALARSSVRDVAANHLQTQRWERSLADLQTASASTPVPPIRSFLCSKAWWSGPSRAVRIWTSRLPPPKLVPKGGS